MSDKFRHKFEGIQRYLTVELYFEADAKILTKSFARADSVTWNPHKLMNVVLQCSTVHFKQNVISKSCHNLFKTAKLSSYF